MKKLILFTVLCLIISSAYAIYYKIPYSARPAALGEATVSLLGDANNIFYNPASLNSKNISFNLTEWFVDTRAGSCFGSYRYENYFTVGAGVTYFTYGQLRYFDAEGNPGDYFNAGLWQYRLSIAKQLYHHISLGVGAKLLDQNIATVQTTQTTLDYGLIYYAKLFNVGASLHNPTMCNVGTYFDIGASAKPIKDLLLLVAINYQDALSWRAGIEYNYKPMSFRIGYNNKRLAFGIGYHERNFSLDYALANYNDLGLTHQFSITIK
jgi:long-subunit fatty acid transport protein